MYPCTQARGRRGFTLVEMLVVLVLILVLAAIAVALVPKVSERQRAAKGADQIQAALLTAKQMAIRDQAARGVRLQPVQIITLSGGPINPVAGTATVSAPTSGYTGEALPWSILPGMSVVVSDADPLNPADTELFSNVEVVLVTAVTANSFTATGFKRQHFVYSAGGQTYPPRVQVLRYVRELQYIEQPDDYSVLPGLPSPPGPPGSSSLPRPITATAPPLSSMTPSAVILQQVSYPLPPGAPLPGDFSGGIHFLIVGGQPQMQSPGLWAVQAGDYIEIKGGGPMRRITTVSTQQPLVAIPGLAPPQCMADALILDLPPLPFAITQATRDYRIIRAPRVRQGEAPVQLPQGVAIDLSVNLNQGTASLQTNQLPIDQFNGTIDILFSPNGGLTGRALTASSNNKVILYVRDVTLDSPTEGGPTLVTIYNRTGLIAAHPVNTQGADPYSFTRDGRSSGL
jgi:prepilin-type N-terminal cleavage/methylation domain-containing protein